LAAGPVAGGELTLHERWAAIGLPPLAEKLREINDAIRREGERMPADAEARRREIDAWERSVGWHD